MSNPYNLPLLTPETTFDPFNSVVKNTGPFTKIECQSLIKLNLANQDLLITHFEWNEDICAYLIEYEYIGTALWCRIQIQIVWHPAFNNVCCVYRRLDGSHLSFRKIQKLSGVYFEKIRSNIRLLLSNLEDEDENDYIAYGTHGKPYNLSEYMREYLTKDFV